MLPGVKPGVVLIAPDDLQRVISAQLGSDQIDAFRDVIDINHALIREFIHTTGARAAASKISKRDECNIIVGPCDFQNGVGSQSPQILRWRHWSLAERGIGEIRLWRLRAFKQSATDETGSNTSLLPELTRWCETTREQR